MNSKNNETSMNFGVATYANPFSIGIKSLIGLVITVVTAVTVMSMFGNQPFMYGFTGLFATIILYVVMAVLLKKLAAGSSMSAFMFLIICVLEGVLFANIISFLTFIATSSYGLDSEAISATANVAFLLTVSVVLGSLAISLKATLTEKRIQAGAKAMKIIMTIFAAIAIFGLVGLVLSLFGINFMYSAYASMMFGLGPISILLSVLLVALAAYNMFSVFLRVRTIVEQGADKNVEYVAAATIVMAIISVYIEIFRLLLKFAGRSNN